ncbi:hypothetical protein [Microbacterium sp. SS28]|uniref:hypothetical protein n=1 Tax=Microbacterium sp. SS28 TaxID=2919948 RepID=UPI001FAB31BA|nr:hypothetical protein [Microbacterium sp. SS28]
MNDQARAELRELQARAYGPAGDIHDDPAALRRLEELQARIAADDARVARGGIEGPDAPPQVAQWSEPDEEADGETTDDAPGAAAEVVAEAAADEASVPRSRWRGWVPWLWVASVLVAGGVAASWNLAGTALSLLPIGGGGPGAERVEVILVDPDFQHWDAIADDSIEQTGFSDFYGMTPIASTGGWWGADIDETCLALARTADVESGSENINGPFYTGCSAGPFSATLQFIVTPDFPDEFLERFPEGEAMKFVLDGDRVGVFIAAD